MTKPDIRGIIFDMDGVIADTARFHYQSWEKLAQEEGIAFTWETHLAMLGTTREESLRIFTAGLDLDAETRKSWFDRKNHYFLELMRQLRPGDTLPGVERIIDQARAAHLKIAVGSSSKNAFPVLDQLELRAKFDVIGDGYSVERSKPAPDIFLWVAGALGLPPRHLLVLEDSPAGIEAARTGGFYVIGLGDVPLNGAHALLPGLADHTLQDLLELL
jgi:kojibiose phosphorylase